MRALEVGLGIGFHAVMRLGLVLAAAALLWGCRPSDFTYRQLQSGQTPVVDPACKSCNGTGYAPKPYPCGRCGTRYTHPYRESGWPEPPSQFQHTASPYGKPTEYVDPELRKKSEEE